MLVSTSTIVTKAQNQLVGQNEADGFPVSQFWKSYCLLLGERAAGWLRLGSGVVGQNVLLWQFSLPYFYVWLFLHRIYCFSENSKNREASQLSLLSFFFLEFPADSSTPDGGHLMTFY